VNIIGEKKKRSQAQGGIGKAPVPLLLYFSVCFVSS